MPSDLFIPAGSYPSRSDRALMERVFYGEAPGVRFNQAGYIAFMEYNTMKNILEYARFQGIIMTIHNRKFLERLQQDGLIEIRPDIAGYFHLTALGNLIADFHVWFVLDNISKGDQPLISLDSRVAAILRGGKFAAQNLAGMWEITPHGKHCLFR